MIDPLPYLSCQWESMGRGPQRFDCWGLVRHVLAEEFGVQLPSYSYGDDPSDAVMEGVKDFDAVEVPRAGDLALFSNPLHIGIMLCTDSMLHISSKRGVCVERLSAYRTKRVEGFFRVRNARQEEPVRPRSSLL